jgi:ribosome maturation factor RimP
MAHKGNVVSAVEEIATPVAEKLALLIWDIEFVKEGSTYFLRFYIDKEGSVDIDDCEAFSRAVEKEIDKADPIEQSYCLEVSSPGIERELKRDWHFKKYIGKTVKARLIRPDATGRRDIEGKLVSFESTYAGIETDDTTVLVKRSEASSIRLADEYTDADGDNTLVEE